MESRNPYTNQLIHSYAPHRKTEMYSALEQAQASQKQWKQHSFAKRAQVLQRLAELLRQQCEALAPIMTQEMGKPISEARAEINKCAWVCDYYAEHAEAFLAPESIDIGARESFVAYTPLGTVLAIMPWNFPFWQVLRCAAPTLMAGNALILKHAPNVSGCGEAIARLFETAGLPEGLFHNLRLSNDQVAELLQDSRVHAVALTGSTRAGRAVASQAGAHLKKCVLELGGSDPYLILEDADLELAVQHCVTSRMLNSGQSCIAAKRFIVLDAVYEAFEALLLKTLKSFSPADPGLETTRLGPLARHDLRDTLHAQVQNSIAKGAQCLLGGEIPAHPGALYPATVLSQVAAGMPAYDEELFGPVVSLIRVQDTAEALAVANDTVYGLGAALFSKDTERAKQLALEIEAGNCFINDFVKSDPRLPFGGIKQSGYGRELGLAGIREFVNVKTICLA